MTGSVSIYDDLRDSISNMTGSVSMMILGNSISNMTGSVSIYDDLRDSISNMTGSVSMMI